jgi:hypothetical protein
MFGLTFKALARFDRRRIACDVTDQPAVLRVQDESFML